MARIEPRHEPDLQGLTFRRRARVAETSSDGRFAYGVAIFLLVALAHPWYSYWVQKHLLARDIEQGVSEFSDQMDRELRQLSARTAAASRAAAARTEIQRIGTARVVGISDGRPPLAVVDFGQSNIHEADEVVCRQTALWLRRSVAGTVIRVQNVGSRGTENAITELACP